ncbi:MAG: Crp/Fnr family transcriptional regulator [Candidatus Tectomicrobia bacterium]|uniref:Crp/Fnr family transcriptional regulator n=1 Tax=Tectimicrobiota bacterium TaxID=2528274 RepID=A0A937W5K0_UNCTE|nr:Crp/Fnr family transcriptional regulator [Candidatus Tectomicrobia bacterium]
MGDDTGAGGKWMLTYNDFLKKVPLFSELDEEELHQLATVMREQHYKKHTTIVHVDDPGSALYILKSGLVKITIEDQHGYEMILRILYPTDFFGEMSLLDGMPRSATVTTQEVSEVLTIAREHFLHIVEKSPKLLLKMTAVLSKRLRKANELIHSLAFFDVYGKVARVLLNLAAERGRVTEQGTVIDMRLTQQELADLAGMTRETMARTLREFQQAGCIRVESGIISILALDMLRREIRQA